VGQAGWCQFCSYWQKITNVLAYGERAKPQAFAPSQTSCMSKVLNYRITFHIFRSCSVFVLLLLYRGGTISDWLGMKAKSRAFYGLTSRPQNYGHLTSNWKTSMSLTVTKNLVFYFFTFLPYLSLPKVLDQRERCVISSGIWQNHSGEQFRCTLCVKIWPI